ncbi:MAG: hypothetical protein VYC34_03050, partial [Planctomycetota bacterium]|nr:hypothetical protein [Planctomycetota bacterium]
VMLSAAAATSGARGFVVVCPGAEVAPDARLVDTIVMPGAVVRPGVVAARSIICPGAAVEANAELVDVVVSPDGIRSDAWANARDERIKA